MGPMYYIGLDVHKLKISYCVKDVIGKIHAEGWIPAKRFDLDRSMKTLPQPWRAAMEATLFTGRIYDHLKPHAAMSKVKHPPLGHRHSFGPAEGAFAASRLFHPWKREKSPAFHASRSPGVLRSQSGRISLVTARRSCQRSLTDGRPQNQ